MNNLKTLLETWECPICLESAKEVSGICLPFNCNHITCFSCLTERCKSFRDNQKCALTMKCCLCEATTNDLWLLNKILHTSEFNFDGRIIKIYGNNICG